MRDENENRISRIFLLTKTKNGFKMCDYIKEITAIAHENEFAHM